MIFCWFHRTVFSHLLGIKYNDHYVERRGEVKVTSCKCSSNSVMSQLVVRRKEEAVSLIPRGKGDLLQGYFERILLIGENEELSYTYYILTNY